MELGRDGGMDGLHVRGVRAFIPRERRDWAELLQEEGIFPKVGPRGQATTSQRLPVGSQAGGGPVDSAGSPLHWRCVLCSVAGQTLVPAMPRVTKTPRVPAPGVR